MQVLWWLTGCLAIIAGCRFIILAFRRLTSKENMNALIDRAEDGFQNTFDKIEKNFKKRKKARQKSKSDRQAKVTIV